MNSSDGSILIQKLFSLVGDVEHAYNAMNRSRLAIRDGLTCQAEESFQISEQALKRAQIRIEEILKYGESTTTS